MDTVDTITYSLNIAGIITVDPKGSVKLIGDQIAIVSGTIMAPGGNITLGGGTYTTPEGNPAYQESSPQASLAPAALLGEGVWLTSTGRLSVAGKQIAVPEMSGGAVFRDVLPGGQVTVSGGDIVLARGSVIDVSGAAGQSTLLAAGAFGPSNADPFLPQATAPVTSVGGTISISAVLGAALEGTLLAGGGGAGAAGGTLNITLALHGSVQYGNPTIFIPTGYWPQSEDTFITLVPTVGDSQIQPGAVTTASLLNANVPLSAAATTLADGSALTSGYFISSGSGATDEHWSVFKVMSGPVARQYSQIVDSYANTFFPQLAAVNGTAVPRLPQDAGQLSITASSSLTFQGTGAFTPASGGLGGVADISGNQILVVDDEAAVAAIAAGTIPVANYAPIGGTTDPDGWAPLVLAATDLNKLEVESLLLGGSRSFQSDGVHITATATAVVIANDAASPLSLPDIQVIAGPTLSSNPITLNFTPTTIVSAEPGTGQVIIAPGAVIQASGTVAGGGESNIMLAQATPLSSGASTASIQAYYLAVADDQVGYVRVSDGNLSTLNVKPSFAGLPSGAGLPTNYPTNNGSLTIGAGAQLISDNSILLCANNTGTMAAGVKLTTNTLEVRSGSSISLGTDSVSTGIVLDQGNLTAIGGVRNLVLVRDRYLRRPQSRHPRSGHRTADVGHPHSRQRRAC